MMDTRIWKLEDRIADGWEQIWRQNAKNGELEGNTTICSNNEEHSNSNRNSNSNLTGT